MDHDIYLMFDSQMGCSKEQKEALLRNQIPGTHGDPYDISFIPETGNKQSKRKTNFEQIKKMIESISVYYSLIFLFQIGVLIYYLSKLINNNTMSTWEIHITILFVMFCQMMMAFLRIIEIHIRKVY